MLRDGRRVIKERDSDREAAKQKDTRYTLLFVLSLYYIIRSF